MSPISGVRSSDTVPLMASESSRQKVVICGAGPVGSLAALYAAQRGVDVHVYELREGRLLIGLQTLCYLLWRVRSKECWLHMAVEICSCFETVIVLRPAFFDRFDSSPC